MKTLILSDLHLEISDMDTPKADADVVVLAGDIAVGNAGIYWARTIWPTTEIVYVAGNHEFYGKERNSTIQDLRRAAKETGVHFLDNDEVMINGVRFLGATLWTDFLLFGLTRQTQAMGLASVSLNDFRMIREGEDKFTSPKSVSLFNESARWLKLKLSEPFDGKTIVVTHHLPSAESVAERYKKDLLSACFASNADHLLGPCNIWIHGHTHDCFDYISRGTRVICNPRGYVLKGREENVDFNPEFVIEV